MRLNKSVSPIRDHPAGYERRGQPRSRRASLDSSTITTRRHSYAANRFVATRVGKSLGLVPASASRVAGPARPFGRRRELGSEDVAASANGAATDLSSLGQVALEDNWLIDDVVAPEVADRHDPSVRRGRCRKGRARRYLAIGSGAVVRDVPGTIADQAGRYAQSVRGIPPVASLAGRKCGQPPNCARHARSLTSSASKGVASLGRRSRPQTECKGVQELELITAPPKNRPLSKS